MTPMRLDCGGFVGSNGSGSGISSSSSASGGISSCSSKKKEIEGEEEKKDYNNGKNKVECSSISLVIAYAGHVQIEQPTGRLWSLGALLSQMEPL